VGENTIGRTGSLEEFIWTDSHIRWMSDAAQKSRYYYWIAEHIAAYLPPASRVFCAGGGLGDLAIWISYHVEQVTVIESDPKAVAAIRARCPQNVVVLLGDVFSYAPDRLFDSLVLYDAGDIGRVMPVVREISRAKTFLVQPLETDSDKTILSDTAEALKEAGIPFNLESFEHEQIQPLRAREDAGDYFFSIENRTVSDMELDELLEQTTDPELPYVYRKNRKIGMIVFNAANPALKKPIKSERNRRRSAK
jgi:hypothetical protein